MHCNTQTNINEINKCLLIFTKPVKSQIKFSFTKKYGLDQKDIPGAYLFA